MPMKLPKSFQRRKSSGNILEDVETRPQSSFKVFERPGPHRSMTDGAPLTKRMSEGNVVPSMLEDDNIFAGTEQPLDKNRGATYESSTSTRLSSSSTLPSSTEIPSEDTASPHSRIHDIPVPPPLSGALRAAAGRTFSFGGRFSKNSNSGPPAPPRHATPPEETRQRTVSGSTNDTATPPKLPDSHWDLGAGSDDFGKMFDHLGKRDSAMLRDPSPQPQRSNQYSSSPPTQALPEFQASRNARPPPISTDRSVPVEPSPYSWDSRHTRHYSQEGLLNDHDAGRGRDTGSPAQSSADTVTGFRRLSPGPNQTLGATTSHRALERPNRRQSNFSNLRRSGVYSYGGDASPIEDEDANLVRKSLLWTDGGTSPNATPYLDKGKAASPIYAEPEPESMFSGRESPDPAIADHGRLAVQFAESVPKRSSPGNKVMTPSQFEHYRQQQELRRSNSNATKSDDESVNDEFDDEEDEAEKQRETERQRRKQEAHLSVYRQQMMKVTGQKSPSPSLRPEMSGASSSTPNLNSNRLSHLGDKSSSGKSAEEDDDEVPLGILAAHGFPNRNRPPTRLNNASSNPNLRASLQPSYASSAHSIHGAEPYNRSNLPAFARNLPPEPYVGAGLVRESNRESLAFGGGSGSVYGGASSPAPPPGGLINVIANEERARAARRGSPNTQAMFDPMGGMGGMGAIGGGIPRPYSMMPQQQGQITPSEQAQLNLSNQMSQMVQMQMDFMRNMMAMQGGQGTPPPMMPGMQMPPGMGMPGMPMPMPGMPTGPPSISGGRPVSMPNAAAAQPNFDQRTLGLLDPNNIANRRGSPMPTMSGYPFPNNNPGYAASIAPSERSNAGLASRYRPVSMINNENERPGTSPNLKPWNDENHLSPMSASRPHSGLAKSTTMATVTVRPVSQAGQSPAGRQAQSGSGDEDEDEGWADMMKKRDKKKSSWKMKRATSSFGDLLGAVH